MQLTKKIEKEVLQVYDTWLHSYLNGDVVTYDSYFDDEYHFIGSTNNEEFLSRKDTTQFFADTAEQLAGKCDLRNESRTIELFGEIVFITHVFDAWFLHETDWSYYSRFRFTNALRKSKDRWQFIYQHFSTPDSKTEEGETIGFDKVSAENQELREAIKRRTFELEQKNRELEIETALERIRAQVTGMEKSEDLLDIVVSMRNEFVRLGHEAHYFWHMRWHPDTYEKAMTSGDGTRIGNVMSLPRRIHGEINELAAWEKSDEPTIIFTMDVEAALDYVHKMAAWGDFQRVDPNMPTDDDIRHIGGLTYVMARTSLGEVGYSLPGVVKNVSQADVDLLVRFARAFDLAHKRFEDLKKSERQAREMQLELSLERVRSQVTAMQESSDLFDIVVAMRKEFLSLGHEAHSFWHMRWMPDQYEMSMTSEDGNRIGMIITVPKFVHDAIPNLAAWEKSKEPTFVLALDADGAWDYIDKMNTYGRYEQVDPHAPTQEDIQHIGGLTFIIARTTHGEIGFSLAGKVTDPPEASIDTLVRFAAVFDLAYKRFSDLKAAERQHREAQIDLALEKVRSRTMAMQHSDELSEAANLLFTEVQKLGIPAWSCGYNILSKDKTSSNCIMSSEGELQAPFILPLTEHESLQPWHQAIVNEEDFFVYGQDGSELVAHYDYMKSLPELKSTFEQFDQAGLDLPTRQFNHLVRFSKGFLLFITYEAVPEAHDIFIRFGKVFEQTYTRFLDLQRAEAQAREKEIELGLEKVRSRAMAMQKSEELSDLVKTVFTELTKLDFAMSWCMINIIDEETADNTIWAVNPDTDKAPQSYRIKFGDWPYHQASFKAYQERKAKFVYVMEGKEKEEFEEFLFNETDAANISDEAKTATVAMKRYVHSYSFSNFGGLQTVSETPLSEGSLDILARFGKVFDLTYTRFNDLKLAEAQAREAQIEASLERVRSRAVAMRHSDELSKAAEVLYHEFLTLGLESFSCGYLINDDENAQWKVWLTNPGEAFFKDFWTIPYDADPHLKARYESWQRKKEFHRDILDGEQNRAHHVVISKYAPWKAAILDDLPHRLVLNSAHFSLGHLFVISPDLLSKEMEQAMVRFAGVFDLAYRRFLDLQVAEEQARKIREERDRLEKTLHDLQATQKQLIHSEKMASLGELTAGIAHEIQNPLNFVNNFSEVSSELLEEMNEEIDKGDLEEVKAIIGDIKQNLEKINHHGQRADAIVKGMLQHSRKSTGEKTPTDLNQLADEYLRLAYHGLRAKDKSFNATLNTDFDPSLEKIEVIPQDIGRVLLNLITNAFYAVNEKKKNSHPDSYRDGYRPTVTISTKKFTDHITIAVKDNGNGIPQPVLDKIFQPFFTTKPTGQGTGLGLSLSYDIVKAHGGKITIDSQENTETKFTIFLPLPS